ncbi:MAG: hypothetical protein KDD35_09025, partial [Bdellovibrionales bacterium]|nr:hypothetical protein [Bdellovibrionales bacterium]
MNLLMIQNILPLFKNFLFLLGILALSFLPSISPASAATTKNAASADPVYQRTFDQLMDNEWISHIYFRLQQNLLSSHSDHEFSQFIASSPLLIKMRESFLSQQEYLLEKVLYRASQNMETVVPGKKYFDKSIDFLLVQAARDLGFSPNSIANRKIYLDYRDPDNAASLSLSPDQITVVIGANLARQTPPENLRSLLGHELAHSLSFHGANRHIENLLNAFLLEVFTRGLPSSFDRRDLIRMVNTVGRLYQDQSPLCHSGRRAVLEELGRNFRNKSAEKSQLVLEGLGLINQLPRHEIKKLLTSFLETLVRRSQLEKNYEN